MRCKYENRGGPSESSEKIKKGLVNNPQIGRPVPDLPGEIRELIFGKYVARYEVRTNSLYVLRIWHGMEDR